MSRILLIAIVDGLELPSGYVAPSPYDIIIYCKVPEDWIEGELPPSADLWQGPAALQPDKLERLWEALYGKTWRSGNEDGSRYVFQIKGDTFALNPTAQLKNLRLGNPNDPKRRFFYFAADANGEFRQSSLAELITAAEPVPCGGRPAEGSRRSTSRGRR